MASYREQSDDGGDANAHHVLQPGNRAVGRVVLSRRAFSRFINNMFIGTLRGTHLLRLVVDSSPQRRLVSQERLLEGRFGRILDVVAGPDGHLYFCTNNRDGRGSPASSDDRILRLVPAT